MSSGPCTRWLRQTTPSFDCGDCESSADKWILSVYFQRTVQWQSIVIKWPRPLELWFQHFYLEETVESLPKRKAISRLSNRGKKLEGEGIGSTIPTYRLWLRVCAMAVGRLLNTVLSRVANYSAKANFEKKYRSYVKSIRTVRCLGGGQIYFYPHKKSLPQDTFNSGLKI